MKALFLIALLVLGSNAHASIDSFPSSLRFSDTVVGQRSLLQGVTVTNRGPDDVRSLFISSACAGRFDVQSFTCPGQLAKYQSCRINVAFTPTSEGSQFCSFTITGGTSTETVSLSGRGVKRDVSVDPAMEQEEGPTALPLEIFPSSSVDRQGDEILR